MSNHTHSKENPPQFLRNGVVTKLSETQFGKTSPYKGQSFWTVVTNPLNLHESIKALGEDIASKVIERFWRAVAIEAFTDPNNKDEHGHLIWDNVLKAFETLDTGGATKKELADQILELQDQADALTETIEEADVYDDKGEVKADKQDQYNELTGKINEIIVQIRPLKKQRKAIEAKYAAIAAKRQANKAPTA